MGGDRAGEIRLTRFVRNEAVKVEEMVAEAAARTAARCADRHVLVFQDTTVVRAGERRGSGLFLHAALAVDADDGVVLGLAHAQFLTHKPTPDLVSAKAKMRVTPFEEKESFRWLQGAQAAGSIGARAQRVTMIADRESDVFELFAQRPQDVDLLVRAKHDRALGDGGRMFARIDAEPEAGRETITLAVRHLEVEPVRPGAGGCGKVQPGGVRLSLVDVREVDVPEGQTQVHWRLLTTLPVCDGAEAVAVADLYRRRWAIEQLFRTLKTQGFDIESLPFNDDRPRKRLVTAALVAAVTIQQLVHARDGVQGPSPLRPVTDAFDETDRPLLRAFTAKLEGKTARQKNPHPEGSLAYGAWVCARLGGWTGYYGKPGPIVMLEGWTHFQAAKQGALLIGAADV